MSEEEATTTVENVDVETTPEVVEESTENTETVKSDTDSETEKAEEKPEEAKPKADKKSAKLSFKLREANRRANRLEQMLEKQIETASKVQPKTEAPKIEDFNTMDEYLDARDSHRDTQREAKAKPEATESNDYNPRDELFDNGQERYEDFDEVVGGKVNISPEMAGAVFEIDDLDLQIDVAYFLGNNPKEAKRISSLSERRQIAEVTKLEIKLSSKPAKKEPSKAPKPIKPVGGSKTSSSEIQAKDDFETFMKKRNKQLGR